jgi:hypothetical protein
MTTNRKTLRLALRTLLKAEVTSAQEVYGYQKARLKGMTPLVCITSASSERPRFTMAGSRLAAAFDVHTFVLHSDGAAATWTEEDAENMLDDLEQEIAAACGKNPVRAGKWDKLAYSGPTDARALVKIEGVDYLHEVVTIDMQEYI